jgi:CheY-like chemotaxis protein
MKLWSLKGKKIVVVDDFPAMRSMLRDMLKNYSADNIKEARNGEEALELLAEETKDIVLCDYNLGEGKDGQQVLEEAKQNGLLPYSSIFIMTTAENTSEMVMGAVEFQPDEYVVKPFTKVVLQMRLAKLQEKKEKFKKISNAIEENNYPHAINLCNAMLQSDNKTLFEVMKLKGDLLLRLSDYKAAESLYEKVLDLRDVAWAQFGLGKTYYLQKEYEDARQIFEDLIAHNENFVAAYDWLAMTHKVLANNKKCQDVLVRAIGISSKAILRQRALGEISMINEDYKIAEKAYKTAVKDGKNSIHKSPDDYGGLAKVYIKNESKQLATKTLGQMGKDFDKAEPLIQMKMAIVEGVVHKELGNTDQSSLALDKAMQLFTDNPGNMSCDSAMELAETCFSMGKKDQGNELIKHVVRNNHENDTILKKVEKIFTDAGMADTGNDLIASTRKEVVDLNNDGVELAKQDKLKESIRLFQRAARAMPENLVINLNAAQSLIMLMKNRGANERQLSQARIYLDRAGKLDANNDRFHKLLSRYHDLINTNTKH